MEGNFQPLMEFATGLVADSRGRVDDLEVWATRMTSHEFRIENRRVFPRLEIQKVRVGLRVLREGGLGYAGLMQLDRDEARRAVDRALSARRDCPLQSFGSCLDQAGTRPVLDQKLCDLRKQPAQLLALARTMRDRVHEEAGDAMGSFSGSVSLDLEDLVVATGSGAAGFSACSLTAFAEVDSVFYDTYWTIELPEDTSSLTELGVRAWEQARLPTVTPDQLGLQGGTADVIMHPRLLESLLRTLGSEKLTGSARLAGISELEPGADVAAPQVTLDDDATALPGLLTRPVDDEGTACAPHRIIDRGRFGGFLYNRSSAIRAGAEPTGHGFRKPLLAEDLQEAPVRERPSHLVMAAGETPLAELLRGMGRGLLLYDLLGLHTADRSRAAFSCSVFCGFSVEQGAIARRLAPGQWNVSGNLFDMPGDGSSGFLRDVALSAERVHTGTAELPYLKTRLKL